MNDTRRAILRALADGPVAGPDIADSLGISRAAVWKQIEALRDAGFAVAGTDEGYAVTAVPAYGGAAVEFGLDAPYAVEYHDQIGSTNDRARELAAEGAGGVAVLADEQAGGRGRLARSWSSPPGGVWCSILLRPDRPAAHAPTFTLAAAVAAAEACEAAGVAAGIKWPNDVLHVGDCAPGDDGAPTDGGEAAGTPEAGASGPSDEAASSGAKLAGVLTEMEGEADRIAWIAVGIGLNANVDPAALPSGATSLRAERGRDVDRRLAVQRLLATFHALARRPAAALSAWRENSITLGRRVRVETADGPVEGEAVDVRFPGALVVRTDDGEQAVHAGDCEHLRPVE